MTELRISDDLALPADVVTQALAIVGRRGSGKTSTGVVLAEELIRAGLPVVVLDPLGVWWGLRADASGEGEGLPVVIFGGDHGDVPLQPGTAELVADVIVDERPPAVLDLSGLDSDAEIRRWCAAFLRRVYKRNRDALQVIIDEADLLAPQQGSGEAAHSLNAMKALFRRGRVRGLGGTLITQRPAALSKEVLNQAEVLVAMQLTGPRDVAAVDDWMTQAGDAATVQDVKSSLPGLATGESWWWSPAWLRMLQRVQVRPRDTFDSSRTPRPGERRPTAERMADVDIARLLDRMSEVVEQAEQEDPARLRKRIGELQRQLRDRPAVEPERVEVPVLSDDDRAAIRDMCGRVDELGKQAAALLGRLDDAQPDRPSPGSSQPQPAAKSAPRRQPAPERPATTGRPDENGHLKAGAVRMLEALARQYPLHVTRAQLGTLAGIKTSGGTFSAYFSALRRGGYIDEQGGRVFATDSGRARVGVEHADPLTVDELREQYRSRLKAGARDMLDALIAAYPGSLTRGELAEQVGIVQSGGTFSAYLSSLRTNGLADVGREDVRAADVLFLDPAGAN